MTVKERMHYQYRLGLLKINLEMSSEIMDLYIDPIKNSGTFNDEEANKMIELISKDFKEADERIIKEIEEIENILKEKG